MPSFKVNNITTTLGQWIDWDAPGSIELFVEGTCIICLHYKDNNDMAGWVMDVSNFGVVTRGMIQEACTILNSWLP